MQKDGSNPAFRAEFLREIHDREIRRQTDTITMIASENYVSPRVLQALASPFTNKYSEGEPRRRYYQGNVNVDDLEVYLNDLILRAFDLDASEWHVNAKAVSAAVANFAILNAILPPRGKILSLYLYDGGHLSHGWDMPDSRGVTIASRMFDVEMYHVDRATEVLDYEDLAARARQFCPGLIITGGTAYPREIDYAKVRQIAQDVGACYLADIAHEAGLVVGRANKSPFPHADIVSMSTQKTLRGPRGSIVVCRQELGTKIDRSIFPGLQGGPFDHHLYALAVAMDEALTPAFADYAKDTVANARRLAENFKAKGFRLVSGGTDKHLVVLNLRDKPYTGKDAAVALELAGIVANYNTVPFDPRTPLNPSGVRLGTAAATTRGMKSNEMDIIAGAINAVLEDPRNTAEQGRVKGIVSELCRSFPLWYGT